ncbi:putative glycolipid-binding domain-containing protein [Paractinoplanes toevensis]|uniref:Transcriptional regulator n=1 Tax=Paractinoplanes toevensis TaxID=571911 RepID=A0A919W5H1_9ACTN|nr:putative glycolipid-binding domain-containing protein [Actinoplanes toevensis]GIM92945.1 transcriptional regulator [Actinoplanes toevensis]
MPLPDSLFWERKDATGVEHALVDARNGLYARGTILAVKPIAYTCRYELRTEPGWASAHLDVTTEGAGWSRNVRLELAAGRWRAVTAEQGNLDTVLSASGHARAGLPGLEDPDRLFGAFDVDLGGSPLTNTLPIRRLGLLKAEPNVSHRISAALVLVPSLEVVQADQIYTPLSENGENGEDKSGGRGNRIRYASETFSADLTVDDDGFVVDYPGLAQQITS